MANKNCELYKPFTECYNTAGLEETHLCSVLMMVSVRHRFYLKEPVHFKRIQYKISIANSVTK